jgi:hypothetical protein
MCLCVGVGVVCGVIVCGWWWRGFVAAAEYLSFFGTPFNVKFPVYFTRAYNYLFDVNRVKQGMIERALDICVVGIAPDSQWLGLLYGA